MSDPRDEAARLAERMTRGMMMGPAKYAQILALLIRLHRTAPEKFASLRNSYRLAAGSTP